jgi:hypothetical protein
MKNIGALVAFSLSAPKSYLFEAVARIRLTKFGKSSGVGLSFSWSDRRAQRPGVRRFHHPK